MDDTLILMMRGSDEDWGKLRWLIVRVRDSEAEVRDEQNPWNKNVGSRMDLLFLIQLVCCYGMSWGLIVPIKMDILHFKMDMFHYKMIGSNKALLWCHIINRWLEWVWKRISLELRRNSLLFEIFWWQISIFNRLCAIQNTRRKTTDKQWHL